MFRKTLTIENRLEFDIVATEREECLWSPMTNEVEFENFYNEHALALRAYVRRVSNRAEIADDIVQESFMRFLGAQSSPSRFSGGNEKAYLYRIATNLVYDYFRRNSRELKHRVNQDEATTYEQFTPESALMTTVFHKLKTQERALLWLAYVEGHQHDEIAQMLGLKSLSVRVLLFRARRKLAALLNENNFEVNKL